MSVLPADSWDAVYYSNPIPLSSRSLLAFALLFDRVHFPGVQIPQRIPDAKLRERVRANWGKPLPPGPDGLLLQPTRNLIFWSTEQPFLQDFIHLPDTNGLPPFAGLLEQAEHLVDDTYGPGVLARALGICATEGEVTPDTGESILAFTWPFYQARALQYARVHGLPLLSDDLSFVPPLPPHPCAPDAKALAQQLAVEAVRMTLPTFQSVDPAVIPELRADVQPLARPFRIEMARMAVEVGGAIAAGANEQELKKYCRQIVAGRVMPALDELSRKLREPLRPWHKTALDLGEMALASVASVTSGDGLILGWALFRSAKIASEYATLLRDREGLRKSGLAYLLRLSEPQSGATVAQWDRLDWRCSGNFDLDEPGHPLTPQARLFAEAFADQGLAPRTIRRVWQHTSASFVQLQR